ncbi:hypothetical protein C8R48DRAFT_736949 [Suillus tomentosus]|nr:hypothetical protein C8R48DRAFT_736949 [Suillus tomentosus]
MVTLPEEIMFIWRRPKAMSAVLFLVNRYVAVLGNVSDLIGNFLPVSPEVCSKYLVVVEALRFFQQIFICLTLALRTYALYGRSRRLLIWMGIISLVLLAGALAGTFGDDSDAAVDAGDCYEIYTTATTVRHGMAWVAMFIYELLIFVLTIFKAWKTRGLRFSLISRRDLLNVIFQDGVMYFAGMTLVNLSNILTYLCGSEILKGNLGSFTTCMSVTLISRLMLNLHGCVDTGIFSTPAETSPDVLTTRVDVEFAVSSHHW